MNMGSFAIRERLNISCISSGKSKKKPAKNQETWNGPTMAKNKCPGSRSYKQLPKPWEAGKGMAETRRVGSNRKSKGEAKAVT